jgi:hypothetical protein
MNLQKKSGWDLIAPDVKIYSEKEKLKYCNRINNIKDP